MSFIQQITADNDPSTVAGTTRTISLPVAMSAGNALILLVRTPSGRHVTGVADTQGNTWTMDTATAGSNANAAIASCVPTVPLGTSDSVTFTYAGAGSIVCAWQLLEFSNIARLAADATNGGTLSGASSQTTSVTTTHAVDLVVSVFTSGLDQGAGGITAPGSPWTELPPGSSKNLLDTAYQEPLTPGSVSATWTTAISTNIASAIAAYVEASGTLVDAGSGDAVLSVHVAVPLTDSGTVADSIVGGGDTPTVNLAEAGSGDGVLAVSATVSLADTGSASDAIDVNGDASTIFLADTAVGDSVLGVTAIIPVADAGSGDGALAVTASVPVSDTGSGDSALAVTATVPAADTGSGADALSVTAVVPVADVGSGDSALTVAATAPVDDTGSGDDTLTVAAVGVTVTDIGVGDDAFTVAAVGVTVSDSGAGDDALAVAAVVPATDAGSGDSTLTVVATTSVADAVAGDDTLAVAAVGVTVTDAAVGDDALTVTATAPLADTGSGVDDLTVAALVVFDDAGSATDDATVSALIPLSDDGSGDSVFDAAVVTVTVMLDDSVAVVDTFQSGHDFLLGDSGSGSDTLTVVAQVPLADAGLAAEVLSVFLISYLPATATLAGDGTSLATLAGNGTSIATIALV